MKNITVIFNHALKFGHHAIALEILLGLRTRAENRGEVEANLNEICPVEVDHLQGLVDNYLIWDDLQVANLGVDFYQLYLDMYDFYGDIADDATDEYDLRDTLNESFDNIMIINDAGFKFLQIFFRKFLRINRDTASFILSSIIEKLIYSYSRADQGAGYKTYFRKLNARHFSLHPGNVVLSTWPSRVSDLHGIFNTDIRLALHGAVEKAHSGNAAYPTTLREWDAHNVIYSASGLLLPILREPAVQSPTEPAPRPEVPSLKGILKKARSTLRESHILGAHQESRAQYAIVYKDGRITPVTGACHAAMKSAENVKYIVSAVTSPNQMVTPCDTPEGIQSAACDAFYDWVINRSPYAPVILNRTVKSVYKDGLTIRASGMVHQVLGACVMSRFSREWTYNLQVWYDLVQAGIHENLALSLCYLANFGWDRRGIKGELSEYSVSLYTTGSDHHAILLSSATMKDLKEYVTGTNEKSPLYNKRGNYVKIGSHYYRNPGKRVAKLYFNSFDEEIKKSGEVTSGWSGEKVKVSLYRDVIEYLIEKGLKIQEDLDLGV